MPEFPPFRWTARAEQAALLAAEDRQSDVQIAAAVGVKRDTISRWRRHPDFAARMAELITKIHAAVEAEGIANKRNRIAAYNDVWEGIRSLIAARAADPSMRGVPGGDTGLLVRAAKLVKVYDVLPTPEQLADLETPPELLRGAKREVLVYEYAADTALTAELRATGKQAAQEMGQWTERRELTGADGGAIKVDGKHDIGFDFPAFAAAFADASGVDAAAPDHRAEPLDTPGTD